jgi:hypothetical protein
LAHGGSIGHRLFAHVEVGKAASYLLPPGIPTPIIKGGFQLGEILCCRLRVGHDLEQGQ